jgi:cysteinyl-tRNA synthetase
MTVTLYNTLTRSKDVLEPIEPGKVSLYACGPTVYKFAHIGNLRTYVFVDLLRRLLTADGYDVKHVMNVTDVGHLDDDADSGEDKMIKAALAEGKTAWDIADFYWDAFRKDMDALHVLEPTVWCKATDHIQEQIDQVKVLEDKGYTYTIEGDGIYFDTSKFPDYAKFARLDLDGLQAGARVEMTEGKRNLTDFSLWKFSPEGVQRHMEWDSPWGMGFPGWHIECSAMAIKHLGDRIDVHCGGTDLVPIHHTNEIAQAECALDHQWVNVWMHGEFLTLAKSDGDVRMSKSSGEYVTVPTISEQGYDPLAYRYFLLNAHYRQQLAFSWDALAGADTAFTRLKRNVIELKNAIDAPGTPIDTHVETFFAAARDDLSMPRCLAEMWAVLKNTDATPADRYATLLAMDAILGFGFDAMAEDDTAGDPEAAEIDGLLAERAAAKADKNFARADEIRDELTGRGIEIKDTPEGATWRRK